MVKNYLLVAFQHLLRQKLHTLINVVGLAVGLACFILISLFVRYELAYDSRWANADRIVRISPDFVPTEVTKAEYAGAPPQTAALLKEDFAGIETVARILRFEGAYRSDDGAVYLERDSAAADNSVLEIFDFEWLRGDPKTALAEPNSVVLTRSTAHKYFGDAEALGKTLTPSFGAQLQVTGVIADLGDDTHLRFSMLTALVGTPQGNSTAVAPSFHTYALLRSGTSVDEIRKGLGDFAERRAPQGAFKWTRLEALPVRDIHLYSHREGELATPGSSSTVRTFAVVAGFILLLACINFMNLATARATQRAKEIGVRKVVGAERAQIIGQLLAESVLVASVALLLALAIVEVALPAFNALFTSSFELRYLDNPGMIAGLVGLTLVTGLSAGSYPAFYLAAFEPGRVLKGDLTRGGGAAAFRRGLVVLQFAISIALLIATGVVYEQTRFAQRLDLGFDKDRVVVVANTAFSGLGSQWDTLKREWLAIPEVTAVSGSQLAPGMDNTSMLVFIAEGQASEQRAPITELFVDYGFFEMYGVEVLAGRVFDDRLGTDRAGGGRPGAYVISEGVARRYGWTPQQAVGKWLQQPGVSPVAAQFAERATIVGVVKDIYFKSIRSAIEPTVYMLPPENMRLPVIRYASLKITGRDLAATLDRIDAAWKKVLPNQPISRRFLDDDFAALYAAEQRQGRMLTLFSALAIGIACLGLFGLALFTTERRTKEIGIRKAVGGGVGDIVLMFCGEFGRLVLFANLAAWPIAYFAMQRWLSAFVYRIDLGFGVFVASAAAALVVACVTVGAVAARAASAKPIHSLRYE